MTGNTVDWKRRAEAAFAPLHSIDRSWFPKSLRQHARLLDVAMLGAKTRRLLYAYLPKADSGPLDNPVALPAWAEGDHSRQRLAVLRLGAFACAVPMRHTIEQQRLNEIRRAIDDDMYCDALRQTVALIENDISDAWRSAMQLGEIHFFIVAMGISVLQSVAPEDDAFIRHRLRYQFARKIWTLRRSDLICNRDRANEILGQDANV